MGKRSVRLAKLIVDKGWVSQERLRHCLKELQGKSNFLLLAQQLLEKGMLTQSQLDEILQEMKIRIYRCLQCRKTFLASMEKSNRQWERCPQCQQPFVTPCAIMIHPENTPADEEDGALEIDEAKTAAEGSSDTQKKPLLALSGIQTASISAHENYRLTPPPPPRTQRHSLRTGQAFGKYKILQRVAAGGMGVIYKAQDTELGRVVALKMMNDLQDQEAQERFLAEARTFAKLRHRNIIPVHEIGKICDAPFIAMDFISGGTLSEAIRKSWFPLRYLLEAFVAVCKAVDFAHQQGVIHRDLKSSNILLDEDGVPLVTDFGLACDLNQPSSSKAEVIGSPPYMAPEQIKGEGVIDQRTDVYALGIILYEILTGRLPFTGETAKVFYQIIHSVPPAPAECNPRIHQDLETIALKAMAKSPSQRYASAADLAADVERFLNAERVFEHSPSPVHQIGQWLRRHRYVAALLGFAVVFLVGLLVILVVHFYQEQSRFKQRCARFAQKRRAFLLQQEKWDQRMQTWQHQQRHAQQAAKIYLRALAVLYHPVDRGRLRAALEFVDKALRQQADFSLARYQKGRLCQRLCQWQEALQAYQQCGSILSARYYQAKIYLVSNLAGNPATTRQKMQACLAFARDKELPEGEEEFFFLAKAYLALLDGDRQQALQYCQRAAYYYPFHPELYPLRGYIYGYFLTAAGWSTRELRFNRWRDLQKAEIYLIEGLRLDPLKIEAYYQLAMIRMRLGDLPKALEFLNRAISYNPQDARLYCYRGWMLLLLNKAAKARRDLDRAVELPRPAQQAYLLRAHLHLQAQRLIEARQDLKHLSLPLPGRVCHNLLLMLLWAKLQEKARVQQSLRRIEQQAPICWRSFMVIFKELQKFDKQTLLSGLRYFDQFFTAPPQLRSIIRSIMHNPVFRKAFSRLQERLPTGPASALLLQQWMVHLDKQTALRRCIEQVLQEVLGNHCDARLFFYTWHALISGSQDSLLSYYQDRNLLGSAQLCYRRAMAAFRWLTPQHLPPDRGEYICADLTKAHEWNPRNLEINYALALIHALLGRHQVALQYLQQAWRLGWQHPKRTAADPAFLPLHAMPLFQRLINKRP